MWAPVFRFPSAKLPWRSNAIESQIQIGCGPCSAAGRGLRLTSREQSSFAIYVASKFPHITRAANIYIIFIIPLDLATIVALNVEGPASLAHPWRRYPVPFALKYISCSWLFSVVLLTFSSCWNVFPAHRGAVISRELSRIICDCRQSRR